MLALLLVLLALALVMCVRRRRRPGEPPLVQGWVPFLGKALEFKRDSYSFLEDLRRKHGDVFTVLIAGRYMTFITDPLYFPNIIKLGRQLDFHEFSDRAAANTFGYCVLDPEQFPGLKEEVRNTFHLLQGQNLTPLSDSMMRNLMLIFREDYLSRSGGHGWSEWRTGELYDFCFAVAFEATFMTIYGRSASNHRHKMMDAMMKDFVVYDNMFPMLFAEMPLWLLGQTKEVRQRLISHLDPSFLSQCSSPSLFSHRRSLLFQQYDNLSSHDKAGRNLGILWASSGNTTPAVFWTVYYLLRHKEALQAVRRELQEVMSQDGLEFSPDQDLILSRDQVDRLVYLESAVNETLRLHSVSVIVRLAHEDFPLKLDPHKTVSVRKGDFVSMFPQSSHFDPEIYHDPTSYRFDRYIKDGKLKTDFYKNGQRVKYYLMPFGAGATMCPGRYIAVQEIKQFVCLLLLYFDVELVDERATVTANKARAGLGIPRPANGISFRYRPRLSLPPQS